MPQILTANSPVHHLIEALGPSWGQVGHTPIALHFGAPDEEAAAAKTLGLCDISGLLKLGVKGPSADAWLQA